MHTLVLLEVFVKDVQQWRHEEVSYLRHSVSVLILKHVADRLTFLVESWIVVKLSPHTLVLLIILHIFGWLVHIKLVVTEVLGL